MLDVIGPLQDVKKPPGTSPSLVQFLDLGQTSAVCQRSVRAFATPANGTPSQAPFWVAPKRSAALRRTAMTTNAPESLPRSKKGGEIHGRAELAEISWDLHVGVENQR